MSDHSRCYCGCEVEDFETRVGDGVYCTFCGRCVEEFNARRIEEWETSELIEELKKREATALEVKPMNRAEELVKDRGLIGTLIEMLNTDPCDACELSPADCGGQHCTENIQKYFEIPSILYKKGISHATNEAY